MQYTRQEQEKFLNEELSAILSNYLKLIRRKAIALLSDGEVFLSQYIKIDKKGNVILKMRNSRGLPRKGDYFCAVLLVGEMAKFKNWGDIFWADLRHRYQKEFSEVHCVWLDKTDSPDFSLVGIRGVSLELAQQLKPGCVLVLGPNEPPIAYYQNLISILRNEQSDTDAGRMLDYDRQAIEWSPVPLKGDMATGEFFQGQLSLADEIIVQGPPGTGKTYKMADFISVLPKEKSVLVTALTNRALMELAGKDKLSAIVNEGNVYKTNLTTDESKEIPNLQTWDSKNIHSAPGDITLATFYVASYWAKISDEEQPFDYVIMDEASQAFYVMVCAAKKLGKKVIWIGDQCQMPPVINVNPDRMLEKGWLPLSFGFKTLCENFSYPSFLLSETFRLTERACAFTSIFYNGTLHSVAEKHADIPVENLSAGGGPSLIKLPLPSGNRSPQNLIDFALQLAASILAYNSKLEIAVLSKFRTTVKKLQRAFINQFGDRDNILIDTVERVQGMTCDVCIFCIPNDLQQMSLEKTFFNVATSRSKYNTVIICDEHLIDKTSMDVKVRDFLTRIERGDTPVINKEAVTQTSGLKVVGKIDLSKFEHKKKVIEKLQQNYFIIDTNVFVDCPDVISRISAEHSVVLSAKVADELDKMKITLNDRERQNAEIALRVLNSTSRKIIYELSDPSLLPDDYHKKSPDNLIFIRRS